MKEQLRRVWASVRQPAPADPSRRNADHLVSLCLALLSERGEVSGARLAAEALASYQGLSEAGRDAFLARLADAYSPDAAEVSGTRQNRNAEDVKREDACETI